MDSRINVELSAELPVITGTTVSFSLLSLFQQ